MASLIRTPLLDETTPPYFNLDVGHSAKVLTDGKAWWVKVIDVRGDAFLGVVKEAQVGLRGPDNLAVQVIEFERRHIFGMF